MKNNSSKQRTPIIMGGIAIITSALCATMSGCGHDKADTESIASVEGTTICHTTTTRENTTTAKQITNTTTVQAESTTTTAAVTTLKMEIPTTQTSAVTIETEPVYIPEQVTETISVEPVCNNNLPITDYERTLLRNVVASEYGSDTHGYGGAPITPYERACVVATVMNRVNSPKFPNTIEEVLTQPSQFSGYYACNYEWNTVTDKVRAGVDYYFDHPDEFGDWLYFEGDGTYNYFR